MLNRAYSRADIHMHTQSNRRAYAHSIVHSCTRALAHGDPFLPIIKRRRRRVYKRRVIDRFEIKKKHLRNASINFAPLLD